MNILHITSDVSRGGAATCVRTLRAALQNTGHASRILAARSAQHAPDIETLPTLPIWARLPYHGVNLLGLNYAGIPTTGALTKHPWFEWADVIHYHNLHGGFFNYLALPTLTAHKPTVWTLHDMWALTGHCAHSFECERWRIGCGKCPHPEIDPPIRRDATHWEWKLKQRVYRRSRMLVTTPSRWLCDLAQHSILACRPIRHVNNAVDTDLFRPQERAALRRALNWPTDAAILLFAAESLRNPFKDYQLLLTALAGLSAAHRGNLVLAVLGEGQPPVIDGLRTLALGYCSDGRQLARYYAAADLLAYPTKADNQPRVLIEALSCGCPVVATRVGGVPELVIPGETGQLANAGDAHGFRQGIEDLLNNPAQRVRMSENGRRIAVERHGLDKHVLDMLDAYTEALRIWNEAEKGR